MSEEAKIQLKGPQAILAILVLIAAGGIQWLRMGAHFPGGGPQAAIQSWVFNTYSDGELETRLDEASADMDEEAAGKLLAAAAAREALNRIEIKDMSARKSGKDKYIVRFRFLLDGSPPPDGKSERFLRVEKRSPGGWFVRGEASKFSYYTAFR